MVNYVNSGGLEPCLELGVDLPLGHLRGSNPPYRHDACGQFELTGLNQGAGIPRDIIKIQVFELLSISKTQFASDISCLTWFPLVESLLIEPPTVDLLSDPLTLIVDWRTLRSGFSNTIYTLGRNIHTSPANPVTTNAKQNIIDLGFPSIAKNAARNINKMRAHVIMVKQIPRESLNWPGSFRMRKAW